ncbi:MAG TPA: hypothetical protein VGD23_04445 [Sphingomicrobium sp.]
MAEPVYITVSGPVGEPLSHFRSALLTVATILSVLFLTLLTTIQPTLHKVASI